MRELIKVTYRIASSAPIDPEKKARAIALGQTTDTWTPTTGADQEKLARHRGEVLEVVPGTGASVPGTTSHHLTIGFPSENTEGDIATLLTMIFGKISLDGKIKLLDIEFPPSFLENFPGPRFGVSGVRERLGVTSRPLTMAIFKPCVGLSPQELGHMFYETASGGIDLIKDDEILPNLDICHTEDRLETCLAAAERVKKETGRTVLYAVNLTGPVTTLWERARYLVKQGAHGLLFNVLSYGFPSLEAIAQMEGIGVPIIAHPSLAGAWCGSPEYGMSYGVVLGKLMRLAGADIVLFPSSYGTVALPRTETDAIQAALRGPMGNLKPAFPTPSAGIHPGLVPQILADYGTDVIINAGGGVHGHPQGARAGAAAFQQAILFALQNRDLATANAQESPELVAALATWGRS